MTKIEMVRLLMDPVSLELGPQALLNSSFDDMTVGSELVTSWDFTSATGWNLGAGWSITTGAETELQPNSDLSGTSGGHDGTGVGSGDVADDYSIFSGSGDIYTSSKDVNDYQSVSVSAGDNVILRATDNKPTLSIGTLYKATITLTELSGSVDWQVSQTSSSNIQFQESVSSAGTYTNYFVSDASFVATVYVINVDAGESFSVSEMSIKEVGFAEHDGITSSNLTQAGFTEYQSLKTVVYTISNAQQNNKTQIRNTFFTEKEQLTNDAGPAHDTFWDCNAGTSPTTFSMRSTENAGGVRTFDSISIRPVTLDDWTELGVRIVNEHMCFNNDTGAINITSGGLEMGITQDISDGDTYGSELQPNSDLSGTGGAFDGTGSGSGDIADDYSIFIQGDTVTASKEAVTDNQIISVSVGVNTIIRATANRPSLSSGTLYKAVINLTALSGTVDWLVGSTTESNVQFEVTISGAGVYTVYFEADVDFQGSSYLLMMDAGESCTISEMSIKEVTTAVPVFTPGEHYYSVELTGVDSGSVKLATPSDGTLATFNTVGSRANVVTITDPNIRFEANGACNIDVGAVTLYPVIGGVD
jgi:hypothetical protein